MRIRSNSPHQAVRDLVPGHFREREGYATWRDRGTGDWLLIYTVSGKGRFGYWEEDPHPSPLPEYREREENGRELKRIVVERGDIVVIRPGTLHDYGVEESLKQWELLWAHFQPRPGWEERLNWPEVAPGLMHLSLEDHAIRRRTVAALWRMHRMGTSPMRRRILFAQNALEEALLWCDLANPHSEQVKLDERIRRVMDHLCHHLDRKLGLEDMAGVAGLSVSRLAHLFKQQAGVTPQQYLERQRLERARQLLEVTSRSVKEIAYEVGFENPFYFTLRFKRLTGLSPTRYRAGPTGG